MPILRPDINFILQVKNMIYTRRDSIKKKELSVEEYCNSKKSSSMNRVRPRTTSLSIPKHVGDREDEEYSGGNPLF